MVTSRANNDFRCTYTTILDRWLGLDAAPSSMASSSSSTLSRSNPGSFTGAECS